MSHLQDLLRLSEIKELRRHLHRHPELSGEEKQTASYIKAFLERQRPDRIIEGLGGHGVAAIFDSGKEGPSVLLRADLDALPIEEVNSFAHRSTVAGVSHKCGHDGHMAILSGMAMIMRHLRPSKGRVILLFQPEEETGQGAAKVIDDKLFQSIEPDYVFALHNLPGYEKKTIVFKEGPFASASTGMIIRLNGRSSHAAHPEQGHSPVGMMTALIEKLMDLPKQSRYFNDFTLLTIIHARLGEVAFGTTPGKAVVMATLRTYLNDDMRIMKEKATALVKELEKQHDISTEISYVEEFPATINALDVTDIIMQAVKNSGARHIFADKPFRWSEDFGHFTMRYPGALFGIGSGTDHPSLHNHDYDFPDEILMRGISMFYHITDQLVNFSKNV